MSRLGIGRILAPLSIGYFIAAAVFTFYLRPLFAIPALPHALRLGIAAGAIAIGLLLYASGVFAMLNAYKHKKLCTSGPFSICRHPIYSAWIFFLVPGLAFLLNSLLCLTTPLVMYGLFKVLIKNEDRHLAETFGSEYLGYKKNTPEILPIGWFRQINT